MRVLHDVARAGDERRRAGIGATTDIPEARRIINNDTILNCSAVLVIHGTPLLLVPRPRWRIRRTKVADDGAVFHCATILHRATALPSALASRRIIAHNQATGVSI